MSIDLLPLGFVIMYDDKAYTLVGIEPHTKKDGNPTIIYRFAGECRHTDCAEPVTPSIGPKMLADGKKLIATVCPQHKGWIGPEARSRMFGATQTPEQKAYFRKRQKEGFAAWLASLTPEQRRARGAKRKASWKSLTPEQRAAHGEKAKAGLAAMTPQQKAKHSAKTSAGLKSYHASRTPEQKAALSDKIKAGIARRRALKTTNPN